MNFMMGASTSVGRNIYQAGSLDDVSPWDHMDDDASDLQYVGWRDCHRRHTNWTTAARLLPSWCCRRASTGLNWNALTNFRRARMAVLRHYLFEHGNAGCGDSNWPKKPALCGWLGLWVSDPEWRNAL